ncbi:MULTISPECIES: hypothetical protein [Enterococcus]|uniref:hypothetical protein n=1 Tax=Enterococcus TaxID=1350 RepID=UPI000459C05F|nr:hypothetical protein [Enterococcus faecalis]EGO2624193.1 hypothetical protein [Enterococcus faecalis]EGO7878644.1 hypothetical protein [Enterococcus faecalis]EIP8109117.1 hypothetical protein [Enterococcus faecalis]EJC3087601.1 hypothetical protein [Enterococcus faecalis]EKG2072407.1 hypothetical protein [Enterococcus faecalis]
MTVAISQKRGTANVFACSLFPYKGIAVTVFEALMLAIAFATLIVKISNKNDKK